LEPPAGDVRQRRLQLGHRLHLDGQALSAGYVTVGTDTGHTGDDPDVFVRGAAATKYVNDDPAQGVALTRQLRPYPEQATCG
jgi:hypothetical protein